jgi:hypothetical protein
MPEVITAHAIDIHTCGECPYGPHDGTSPEAKTTMCSHPKRLSIELLEVVIKDPPPATCPHREQMTVLRVVVPVPNRKQRRHLRALS